MTRRLAGAAAMLAAAVVLVLVARDAWHWGRALHDGDARASIGYVGPQAWQADATLPWGLARRALGVGDDLDFRRTMMRAIRVAPVTAATVSRKRRAPVETALARIARDGSQPQRASRADDYLGFLLYTDPTPPKAGPNPYGNSGKSASLESRSPTEKALADFATAATLDPDNANAKRNLESMLRQVAGKSARGKANSGGSERVGNKGSGSHEPGHGY